MDHNGVLPKPKPGILDIDVYVPGGSKAPAGIQHYKLSSNETPFGPSDAAIAAFRAAGANLASYPDGSATALREALGDAHGLNPANIVCGNGSDELLSLIAHCYLEPGDEAIYSEHGFLIYRVATLAAGAKPVVARERDLTSDVDGLLGLVNASTKVIFLANPNNPTGTYLPIDEVCRLHAGLPRRVILVLDAAYAEYVRRNDYEAGIELVSASPNVVMTRTFSKIYGLAALRVGWCYGPAHIVDALNRARGPFNVNGAAMAAGVAALGDARHFERSVRHNEKWLGLTSQAIGDLGLRVTPSVGNFILIHFPDIAGKNALEALNFLNARGFILRSVGAYGLPSALRMTIGSAEANRGVVDALSAFMGR